MLSKKSMNGEWNCEYDQALEGFNSIGSVCTFASFVDVSSCTV